MMVIAAKPIEKTEPWWVTFQSAPMWLVGEDGATRALEAPDRAVLIGDDHYVGDYTGRIQSVQVKGKADDRSFWRCKCMSLTVQQLEDIRCHKMKVIGDVLVPVTDEDKWGERLWAGLKDTTTLADMGHTSESEASPEAVAAVLHKVDFAGMRFKLLLDVLPKNIALSGTGYYATKTAPTNLGRTQNGAPSGQLIQLSAPIPADGFDGGYVVNNTRTETRAIVEHDSTLILLEGSLASWQNGDDLDIYDAWTTIQAAFDQLFTDQGAAAFTALQKVRFYAGTYDENVVLNASLSPNNTVGFPLIIEGDPDVARSAVVLAPSGGTYALDLGGADGVIVRHMTVTTVSATYSGIFAAAGTYGVNIFDCALNANNGAYVIWIRRGMNVEDCVVTQAGAGRGVYSEFIGAKIKRCKIVGPGKASSNLSGLDLGNGWGDVEATIISGFTLGIKNNPATTTNYTFLKARHCVIYNCTSGVLDRGTSLTSFDLLNNIFHTCTQNIQVKALWPEETTTSRGTTVTQRSNYFYNYTNFAYDGTGYKTFAQWNALGLVDATGDVDEVDPKVAVTGLLDADSPCINGGYGSGVPYDVNKVAAVNVYHSAVGCDFSRDVAEEWPAQSDVHDGVDFGPGGDDYTGTSVTTDPGIANVANGVGYTLESVAKTGTDVNTDPGIANVKDGTTYEIRSVNKEGTYDPQASVAIPIIGDVTAVGTTITVPVTNVAGKTCFVWIKDTNGDEIDEQSRSGNGDVELTIDALGKTIIVEAASYDATRSAFSEPAAERVYAASGSSANEVLAHVIDVLQANTTLVALLASSSDIRRANQPIGKAFPQITIFSRDDPDPALDNTDGVRTITLSMSAWGYVQDDLATILYQVDASLYDNRTMQSTSWIVTMSRRTGSQETDATGFIKDSDGRTLHQLVFTYQFRVMAK